MSVDQQIDYQRLSRGLKVCKGLPEARQNCRSPKNKECWHLEHRKDMRETETTQRDMKTNWINDQRTKHGLNNLIRLADTEVTVGWCWHQDLIKICHSPVHRGPSELFRACSTEDESPLGLQTNHNLFSPFSFHYIIHFSRKRRKEMLSRDFKVGTEEAESISPKTLKTGISRQTGKHQRHFDLDRRWLHAALQCKSLLHMAN